MTLPTYTEDELRAVTLGRKLGAGSFGTVYVGLLPTGRFVAVKELELDSSQAPASASPTDAINKEVEVHKRLSHPHIIRYLHSFVVGGQYQPVASEPRGGDGEAKLLHIFLEFVTGGSLSSIMKTLPGQRLPLGVARVYARHVFMGLEYLHANGVAHRDIKCDNILVSQDTGMAKLADFDQAKVLKGGDGKSVMFKTQVRGPTTNTLAGTPYWIAPEVITEEQGYDPFKADVWSAGCTVAEMFTGKTPWIPLSNPMGILYKLAGSQSWPDNIPTDPAVLGPELHSFLSLCFDRNPRTRPSCQQLLQHPFLANAPY